MGRNFIVKSCIITILCSCLAFGMMSTFASAEPEPEKEEEQAINYEKWGKMAVEVVKLNFPEGKVSDYKFKGREEISDAQAKDTFELQVQTKERAFNVRVVMLFNPKTESLISLSIEEFR
ncbi:DUF3889 domain-containing protein [Litchfieldia alkalitelluris]|uniref:DUF3889 domain-containing protein n=1 Tax=Litchfieldia alkalitelluris TaxID=304268 RepID=UPI000995E73B|nr:DUF3889 domain-containing protein [Litchfieldia alkalitelluris]